MQCEVKGWVASFDLCCLLLQLSARLRKGDCKVHPTGSFKCHNENWSLYCGTRMIAFFPQYSWVLSVSLALLAINLPPLQLVNPTVAKGARRLLGSQTRCLSDALSAVTSIRPSLQDDIFQRVEAFESHHGPRRLRGEMVPRGFLRARRLLRAHGSSSSKGRFLLSTEPGVEAKLEEYCAKVPTPLSIAEFTERGRYSLPLKCPLMRIP